MNLTTKPHTKTPREISQAASVLRESYASPDIRFLGKRDLKDIDTFSQHFSFNSESSHKLQARIVTAFKEKQVNDMKKDPSIKANERAHWESRYNKHSAAAWRAYPLTKEFLLSDDDAKFMLQYATGAPTPGLPQFCSCHRILDLEHAVHCDTAKLQRHNMLQHRLVAFAATKHK